MRDWIWTRTKHQDGLERPRFLPLARGQKTSGVAPAQQETSFAARGENLREAGEEGRNYLLRRRLIHLLQLVMHISIGKTAEIKDTRMRKVTREKALNWARATTLFRLSAAQKVRGVAPARYAGSATARASS